MKTFTQPLLAAAAMGAIVCATTLGSAGAMPFSSNTAVQDGSLVQDVRVVCNRNGNCWNTNRYRSVRRGYYGRPGYYAEPRYGYGYDRGYGYGYGGPRVGVGIGPFGFGLY